MDRPILVTAFEPFAGDSINASLEAMHVFSNKVPEGVVTKVLPVELGTSKQELLRAIREYSPASVLCLGQWTGRSSIAIEKIAINCCSFRIPDNAGAQPKDELVDSTGPAAYFSRLPIHQIVDRLSAAQIPADISMHAGTFVCNYVFYSLLRHLDVAGSDAIAGFVHLPALPQQVSGSAMQSMGLQMQSEALSLIVDQLKAVTSS